jgi:hypothetical protein
VDVRDQRGHDRDQASVPFSYCENAGGRGKLIGFSGQGEHPAMACKNGESDLLGP